MELEIAVARSGERERAYVCVCEREGMQCEGRERERGRVCRRDGGDALVRGVSFWAGSEV